MDYTRKTALLLAVKIGYSVIEGAVYHPNSTRPVKLGITTGYPSFSVRSRTKAIQGLVPVHRLVAYIKYGDRVFNKNLEVRHLDGNKFNFNYENIGIGTPSQNSYDKPADTRRAIAIKASSYKRVLSDKEVADILIMRKNGKTYKDIGKVYGLSKSTLSYLFNKSLYAKKA
jgi:DNA-binding CsgD family transcriptional regulator